MSQRSEEISSTTNELEIIEFFLQETMEDGREYTSYFAMNVAKVLEIIRIPPITGVPGKHHPAALGTFNLRGRVLPLVDLSLWLGKKAVESNSRKVIVSEFSNVVTAFVVAGVTRIHRMTWSQVEPPGKYLQAFSHDSVTGVVRFDDRIVFLLDMEQIIGSMNPNLNMTYQAKGVEEQNLGEGYHILVADDSPAIRKTIANTLTKAGFKVTHATCGREAWEYLTEWKAQALKEGKPLHHYIDLLISDIEMPEMDGHSLTRQVKSDPELKKMPVILFSSLISNVVREKGVQAGADDQISKPDLPELTRRTKALIHKYFNK